MSVEILVKNIHSAVPSGHAVGIEHRDQHEHKVFPEEVGPGILQIDQEVEDAVHAVAGRSLHGMDPGGNEHHWLPRLEPLEPLCLEYILISYFLLARLPLMRAQNDHVDVSVVGRFDQQVLLVEVLGAVLVLRFQSLQVGLARLVAVRVGVGELHFVHAGPA